MASQNWGFFNANYANVPMTRINLGEFAYSWHSRSRTRDLSSDNEKAISIAGDPWHYGFSKVA
jgi:hypothetical protein